MFRKYSLVILGLLLTWGILPAQNTLSPYTRFGLGDILSPNSTRNFSMGGIGIGMFDGASINRLNPASYSDAKLTIMDISIFGGQHWQKTEIDESNFVLGGFHNLAFLFPSNKNFDLTFGLAPYSIVGYDLSFSDSLDVGGKMEPYTMKYNANGGHNQAYLGFGFKIIPKLGVGMNLAYVFGTTYYNWQSEFDNSNFLPTLTKKSVELRGLVPELGMQYEDTLRVTKIVDKTKILRQNRKDLEIEIKHLNKELGSVEKTKANLSKKDKKQNAEKIIYEKERESLKKQIKQAKESGTEKDRDKLEKRDRKLSKKIKKARQKLNAETRLINDEEKSIKKHLAKFESRLSEIDKKINRLSSDSLGMVLTDTLQNKFTYRLGFTYNPGIKLKGNHLIETSNFVSFDTVGIIEDGRVKLPTKLGFGLSLGEYGKWVAGVDFTYQSWKNFEYFDEINTLENSFKINAGGEWIPEKFSLKMRKRIAWRAGAFYQSSYLNLRDKNITEFGFTLGAGIPMGRAEGRSKEFSRLNFGMQVSKQGTLENGLLREITIRFRLGITIGQRWFVKRRVE